ncbi:MAG: hypothetical protein H7Y12_01385, partial [Sphingobacteriaceae bacterium]|nr:hypothetical protein [Cytophagaceae bacterium]
QPKGYSASDNIAELIAEYLIEKAMYEAEAARVTSREYYQELIREVEEAKRRNAITGAGVEQRAQEFAKLNYLLGFKADGSKVAPADDLPKPDERPAERRMLLLPAAASQPEADEQDDDAERQRRLRLKVSLLKLKYKYKFKKAA